MVGAVTRVSTAVELVALGLLLSPGCYTSNPTPSAPSLPIPYAANYPVAHTLPDPCNLGRESKERWYLRLTADKRETMDLKLLEEPLSCQSFPS